MTDEQHDAQTLDYSAGIEAMHLWRFGPQAVTWCCPNCRNINHEQQYKICTTCCWPVEFVGLGGITIGLPH